MERIADYETIEQLGEGSKGQVWLCRTPQRLDGADPQAAVKLLTQPTNHEVFREVVEEVKLHASADSPFLVRLFDVGFWDDRVYLAMEHLPGGSLAAASEADRDRRVRAVAGAARGVHALHERGVAHRAVKPHNIFLDNGGAKASEPGLLHLLSPRQTASGVGGVESVEFMDPSVAQGESAGRAADVWSLGACLHYALTGVSVFGSDLPRDSILSALRHVFTVTPGPSEELEGPWREVVGRCVAPDSSEPYPTAEALADDIDRVHGEA